MKPYPAILVVDDDGAIRDVLGLVPGTNWYVVHKASSAADAIEVFRKERIDLVLSDVNMPGRMGPELLRELQSIDPNVRFCFMTAGDLGRYTMQDLLDTGAKAVIQKPFSVESLLRSLGDVLHESTVFSPPHVFVSHLKSSTARDSARDALEK